ncbi:DNA-3-methyladenine glycosylase I [Aureimonas fodinaquatilis]|uniref:DNA-3-methyladenine glycosylase I n=1 Tax=Aureimonas fodinaquatilis TaxID=2565783 RepID=A0A5B0E0R2_9HYPH|nr:DNA-3-methyladenine glycosylase I [Aureimonas fodinaquatilis]KAA0971882.1 DNA-3-methyladenine glycosylase I [Aureimonas fodinaquatilis]
MTDAVSAHDGLTIGDDGLLRCFWQGGSPDYVRYHDEEWGMPVGDDRALYEKLCLEGFQAGLSWITVLRKRAAFREVFEGFDIERVAKFTDADIDRIVTDARIIRHRGKVAATVNNARAVIALREKQSCSFAHFLWQYEPDAASRPEKVTLTWLRANPVSPASAQLSKALRKNGFNFVGPTTCYAFMQSMGFVNDHIDGCSCANTCETARLSFTRP